jgi:VCBS repeat-containing protein
MPFESAVTTTTSDAINDYSSNANHGTLGGGTNSAVPQWTNEGIRGGAYDFDGVDDYIEAPFMSAITKNGTYTFSAWVYYDGDGAGTSETIFQNSDVDDRNGMNVVGDIVRFGYYDGSSWTGKSGAMSTNVWTHLVGINTNGSLQLFINGVSQTGTNQPYVSTDASRLIIGKASISSSPHLWDPFNGKIDEVLIYNKAISTEQINALYNSGLSGNHVLAAAETVKAEVYQVVSTPNDYVEDGIARSSSTVTIENSLPTCAALTKTVNEDTSLTFSAADFTMTDSDGDALTRVKITAVNGAGTFTNNGAALAVNDEITPVNLDLDHLIFAPGAEESGDGYASLEVQVNDGEGYSAAACTVTVDVTEVNDPPEITVDIFWMNEDTSSGSRTVVVTDPDDNVFAFSITSAPIFGTLTWDIPVDGNPSSSIDGNFTYTPDANFHGTDTFSISVSDGVATDTESYFVDVLEVNDSPEIAPAPFTLDEDTSFDGSVVASDADTEDTLVYGVDTEPTQGSVSLNTTSGDFTYTPTANANGDDSFTLSVSDGTETVTGAYTVTISPINDAPTMSAETLSTNEDETLTSAVVAEDVDGDTLTFALVSNGSLGNVISFNEGNGAFTYNPASNVNGTDTLVFSVTDGSGAPLNANYTITIVAVNDPPTFDTTAIIIDEDNAYNGELNGVDLDEDDLSYGVLEQGNKGVASVDENTGAFTYTPNENANGDDSFTLSVFDGTITEPAVLSVTINPINDAPVIAAAPFTTLEDETFTGTVVASDVEGTSLTYVVVSQGNKGIASVEDDGSFSYVPTLNENGSDSFTIRVSDGEDTATGVYDVTITPVNDAPTVSLVQEVINEDTPFTNSINAFDVDNNPLTVTVQTQPNLGQVTLNAETHQYTYAPNENLNGSDSFVLSVSDGIAGAVLETYEITVTPVNDVPTFNNPADDFEGIEDTPFEGTVTFRHRR